MPRDGVGTDEAAPKAQLAPTLEEALRQNADESTKPTTEQIEKAENIAGDDWVRITSLDAVAGCRDGDAIKGIFLTKDAKTIYIIEKEPYVGRKGVKPLFGKVNRQLRVDASDGNVIYFINRRNG